MTISSAAQLSRSVRKGSQNLNGTIQRLSGRRQLYLYRGGSQNLRQLSTAGEKAKYEEMDSIEYAEALDNDNVVYVMSAGYDADDPDVNSILDSIYVRANK